MDPTARRLSALFVSAAATLLFLPVAALLAEEGAKAGPQPQVSRSIKNDVSAPLRDWRMQGPVVPGPNRERKNEIPAKAGSSSAVDPVVQRSFGINAPGELLQFEGGNDDQNQSVVGFRVVPPDTNGDVGPNHYVQEINLILLMFDKAGNLVLGPLPGNAPWAGFGGPCQDQNDGDPIVQYDRLADRWMLSQFALFAPDGNSHQCIAISATGDPTGSYYRYDFIYPNNLLNDYPKFGMWPNGYFMTANEFNGPPGFGALAFERAAMLMGNPAIMIYFNVLNNGGVLPSHLVGLTPPPGFSPTGVPQSPNFFVTWNLGPARVQIWEFTADFAVPGNSTFIGPNDILVPDFTFPVCGSFRDQCVPQLNSTELLETISFTAMYPATYRNFGTHESLIFNHTVDAGGQIAGVRWYELRDLSGTPFLYQSGTYAPDSNHRWMASMSMDQNGNIALGYSLSSSSMYPSGAITGRLAADPLGTMGSELVWLAGTGSQTGSFSRWGDYTSMFMDPTDDCTFWHQNEYYSATSSFDFQTRIAAFKFPSCTAGPTGTLTGTVTDASNGNPIQGALVRADASTTTTNAAGQYSFTLPVDTYDMTASKFGYLPGAASGVSVTDGGTTIQNFALDPAPSVFVNGTVKDGFGANGPVGEAPNFPAGWPLYAKITITGPGVPQPIVIFTDPVTGYYSITLVSGIPYNFHVEAVAPGYEPLDTIVPTAPAIGAPAFVQNFLLTASSGCNAPGYSQSGGLFETFDSGAQDVLPAGWVTFSNIGTGIWHHRIPPNPCGEPNFTGGTFGWVEINSDCDGLVPDDAELHTPLIDLTGIAAPVIQFRTEFFALGDTIDVDLSTDGGTNWSNVFTSTSSIFGPAQLTLPIPAAANEPDVKVRFHNYNAFFAWWWQVDDVLVGDLSGPACTPGPGGLVVGNVLDANNGLGLNGATVENTSTVMTFATPQDPAQPDGFYITYVDDGPHSLTASYPLYTPQTLPALGIPGGVTRVDFHLGAGFLSVNPSFFDVFVDPNEIFNTPMNMINTGVADASFSIAEINGVGGAPVGAPTRFADPAKVAAAVARIGKDHTARSTQGLAPIPNAPAPPGPNAAGNVLNSYPSNIAYGWGVAYNLGADDFWISNLAVAGGDNLDYQYLPDGTLTGNTIDDSPWVGVFAADGTYNHRTGMLWRVDVANSGGCIYELDPVALVSTGNSICGDPWDNISQRGLAYDPVSDNYFIGGWNEGVIYRIDNAGNTLQSEFVGLSISGLAYNPDTQHLFVMVNSFGPPFDVYVLDANNNFLAIGAFRILDGGSPAITLFGGAGMDFDCDGNLWVIDQNTQTIYEVDSGETDTCAVNDIVWLTETPSSGTVPGVGNGPAGNGGNVLPVDLEFDGTVVGPGFRQGTLVFQTDTPYPLPDVPAWFTVRFLDVPDGSLFDEYIYGAAGAGVMPGCGGFNFCPNTSVTRAQMAGYIERGIHGADFIPPAPQGIFADVAPGDFNAAYIENMYNEGITSGCEAIPVLLYCPNDINTRAQASAFIIRAMFGASFVPPPCTGIFADVLCPGGFMVENIELMYNLGITLGCDLGPPLLFCPNLEISQGQMAVFLVRAFQLPHHP